MHEQAHIFGVHAWSVGTMLGDFTKEQWRFCPHGMSNAIWILGHVVVDRKMLGNLLGMNEEITARDRLFEAGTQPDDVPDDVDGAEVLAEYQAFHERFVAHVKDMSDADLEQPTEARFPMTPPTRLGALQFLLMHEGYHVGQLGALHVMTGKGAWFKKLQG